MDKKSAATDIRGLNTTGFTGPDIKSLTFMLLVLLVCGTVKAAGSKGHDFSKLYGDKEFQCYPCHVEEQESDEQVAKASSTPMWEHAKTDTIYVTYRTQSGSRTQVDSISRLCLSCHDGVSAKLTMGNISGQSSGASLGTDLRNDHPIGMSYSRSSFRRVGRSKYHRRPRGSIVLTGRNSDTVSCMSCHDPHGSPYPKRLRESTYKSRLCFQCHDM